MDQTPVLVAMLCCQRMGLNPSQAGLIVSWSKTLDHNCSSSPSRAEMVTGSLESSRNYSSMPIDLGLPEQQALGFGSGSGNTVHVCI